MLVGQVNQMFTAIDAVPDPHGVSNRYIMWVHGPEKDSAPPDSNKFENRTRRWMFNPEWLADPDNKKYNVPSRIVDSGILWGDEKDPEDILAKAKLVADTKAGMKRLKVEALGGKGVRKKGAKRKGSKGKGKQKETESEEQPVASTSTNPDLNLEDSGDWDDFLT
jgi:hypothetical protein